jgi:DNA-binding NarL/FixJ family response regulator
MTSTRPVRLVLVDRHALMLSGIRGALASAADIAIVGEARTDAEALELLRRVQADVVLIDPLTSALAGMAAIGEIRAQYPQLVVIAMSEPADGACIDQALGYGASVYVVKSIHPVDLPSTIRQAVNGTVHRLRPACAPTPATAQDPGCVLNPRELSIVSLAADGLSNTEIGRRLFISDHTVKHYLRQAYRKLGVNSRTGAASAAYRRRILEPVGSSALSVGA